MSTLCMSQCDPPFEKSWLRPWGLGYKYKKKLIKNTIYDLANMTNVKDIKLLDISKRLSSKLIF